MTKTNITHLTVFEETDLGLIFHGQYDNWSSARYGMKIGKIYSVSGVHNGIMFHGHGYETQYNGPLRREKP